MRPHRLGWHLRDRVVKELEVPFEEALATLDKALDLTADIQRAYEQGDDQERRLLNQAFFERLEIVREDTADQKLRQPFGDLIALSREVEDGKVTTEKAEVAAMMGKPSGPPEMASESEMAAAPKLAWTAAKTKEPPRPFRAVEVLTSNLWCG